MATPSTNITYVGPYTIRGIDTIVRAGDCVLMQRSGMTRPLSVARVEKIDKSNFKVHVRWFRRPEETKGGRTPLHGEKELILYDDYDVQSPHAIEGMCNVHSLDTFLGLPNETAEDYYCQFEYNAAKEELTPYVWNPSVNREDHDTKLRICDFKLCNN